MEAPARILGVIAILTAFALSSQLIADTITFGGEITQSTADGTGPAVNNPALNNIVDGDNFLVTLTFTGSVTAPGTYPFPDATLVFADTGMSSGWRERGCAANSRTIEAGIIPRLGHRGLSSPTGARCDPAPGPPCRSWWIQA